ncbi:MAG: (Fe-S)-binding protein [Candidatus Aenigmarchaeota archaeon]|nr:(Fe-S)-binding protein [Candidatus Aenigmarchaeota archaeon]MDW8160105.1 (Fe-S)-binding protein [Candidatus Aenigmarchaeota archaeon]
MIIEKVLKPNVLYYPGCLKKFVYRNLKENYEKILREMEVKFIEVEEEVCCGSPVRNAGYFQQFRNLVRKNFEVFRKYNVGKIILSCPACYYTFSKEYSKVCREWKIECVHAIKMIWEGIRDGRLKIYRKGRGKVTYHDPCHLGRYSGIYEEPRMIIKALGYDLVEMEESRETSLCCGSGGGVGANYPILAREIAKERIEQAKKTRAKILVTSCPLCVFSLKKFSGIKTVEISELILSHVKVKKW